MFNYITATDLELLEHVKNSSPAAVSVAKKYHQSKGNLDIVAKIDKARKVLKHQRMVAQLETLVTDTQGFGE